MSGAAIWPCSICGDRVAEPYGLSLLMLYCAPHAKIVHEAMYPPPMAPLPRINAKAAPVAAGARPSEPEVELANRTSVTTPPGMTKSPATQNG